MRSVYKLGTTLYLVGVKLTSYFNPKAKEWIEGRERTRLDWTTFKSEGKVIWFHCASLGEFEQGKPVMEKFMKDNPNWSLVVSFFSPSGYINKKDFELAKLVTYLPVESKKNVDDFLDAIQPEIAVFVKYEFWFQYLEALRGRKTPSVFISSVFRKKQFFFKSFGKWFLNQLQQISYFFVQDENSHDVLNKAGINHVSVSGDTRFDRVYDSFLADEEMSLVAKFTYGHKVLIFGSAWAKETELAIQISNNLPQGWRVVFAPHEIDENKIQSFESNLNLNVVRYSKVNNENIADFEVLVVDTIGDLARMYKYADIAIVGGGFTDGIHNILEPLVFGCPTLFGPCHNKFWEGAASISEGVGFEFKNTLEAEETIYSLINDSSYLNKLKGKSHDFIFRRVGATGIISSYLNKLAEI